MSTWLAKAWRKRGVWACLLWPVSLVYGALSVFHRTLYKTGVLNTQRVAVPVVVVGNVVAGGAGKTPLVVALAQHFQQQGLQVGVVSRGYGRQAKICLEVLENTSIAASGDEPALVLRALKRPDFSAPVFVATKRIDAAHALIKKYPATQVIISDDGLQHHSLARDIDITVFDDRGIGNGWLLPAGPLRQLYQAGQSKAGLVLHTGQFPAFAGYVSTRRLASHAVDRHGVQIALTSLQGQTVSALAGIAYPRAFFDMLRARGLQLAQTISLPDHFDFSSYAAPFQAGTTVLCTEKDAIKLFKLPPSQAMRLLAVPLEFAPEPAFFAEVDTLLAPLLAIPSAKASELLSQHGVKNGHETA